MKKRIITIALCVVFILSFGTTVYAIPNFEEATVIGDDVNIRLRPSVDSPFVLKLDKGTRIGVFCEEVPGWYRVIYGNYRGYISKDYVFLPSTDILVGNVIADKTPVYQNPGEFSQVIGNVNAGFGVQIKNIMADYYFIEYEALEEDAQSEASPSPSATVQQPSASPLPSDTPTSSANPSASATSAAPSPSASAAPSPSASAAPSPSVQPTTVAKPYGTKTPQNNTAFMSMGALQTPSPSSEPSPSVSPTQSQEGEQTPMEDAISATNPSENEDFSDDALEQEGDKLENAGNTVTKSGYVKKDAINLSTSKQAANLLKEGMKGAEVVKMQTELKRRGFLDASATGEFGTKTKLAISLFQRKADLPEDGIAGAKTLEMLFGDNDIKITFAERMGLGGEVKLMPWSEAQNIFSKGTTAKITDVKTGISWYAKRFGGWFHADSEPVTAEDTANMKKAYGGSWSWDRRAVWVTVDGVTMAGSINGMPHLSWTINDNNFKGHHCIHLYKSKVHQTSAECPRHQSAVQYAYKMGNQ